MEITFNTPALLFPAISLLLLAYTNRFLALASLVRKLHDEYTAGQPSKILLKQIKSLRRRINLIRYMQGLGVFSFLCCVACMYSLYKGWTQAAEYIFAISLLSLLSSLIFSLVEIIQSTNAIELELSDMEELEQSNIFTDLLARKNEKKEP
jgi:cellobiose-specific phosphotransferase system component IIC